MLQGFLIALTIFLIYSYLKYRVNTKVKDLEIPIESRYEYLTSSINVLIFNNTAKITKLNELMLMIHTPEFPNLTASMQLSSGILILKLKYKDMYKNIVIRRNIPTSEIFDEFTLVLQMKEELNLKLVTT